MPPRRRDRRNRRDPSPPPSHPSGVRTSPSSPLLRVAFIVPLLLLLILSALHFTGRLSRSPPHPEPPQTMPLSIYERGLVKLEISSREILAEHGRVSENRSHRHFPNPVLAYVTPWLNRKKFIDCNSGEPWLQIFYRRAQIGPCGDWRV